jgi:hypothetical protein
MAKYVRILNKRLLEDANPVSEEKSYVFGNIKSLYDDIVKNKDIIPDHIQSKMFMILAFNTHNIGGLDKEFRGLVCAINPEYFKEQFMKDIETAFNSLQACEFSYGADLVNHRIDSEFFFVAVKMVNILKELDSHPLKEAVSEFINNQIRGKQFIYFKNPERD